MVMIEDGMPADLAALIRIRLDASRIAWSGRRLQLIAYRIGDYVLPHQDYVATSLISLTTSEADGLVYYERNALWRRLDRAGRHLVMPAGCWHWVDPVICPRMTLTITPGVSERSTEAR
jgi:hypothetical protein